MGRSFKPKYGSIVISCVVVPCAVAVCTSGVIASDWVRDGGGNWQDSANWTGGVPDAPGAIARFLDALTEPGAPANVAVNGNRTVGRIVFENPNAYVIVQGSAGGSLMLDDGSGAAGEATIIARSGAHCLSVPLLFSSSLVVDPRAGARLMSCANVSVPDGKRITKRGGGAFEAVGGLDLAATATFRVEVAESEARYVRGGHLQIADGARLVIPANGTRSGVSSVASLAIDGTRDAWLGQLDLMDNDLIVRATSAAQRDAVLSEVTNQIKSARNSPLGRWNGSVGITSSTARSSALTGLAAVPNPGLATFGGQAVDTFDVLVKYTWNGDATVDGVIDADDYFRIDSGFLNQSASPDYAQGDFNYDAVIDADDYFLIDSSFLGQTGALGGGAAGAATVVPEPAGAPAVVTLAMLTLARRRRRFPRNVSRS